MDDKKWITTLKEIISKNGVLKNGILKKQNIILLILLGVMLFLIAVPFSNSSSTSKTAANQGNEKEVKLQKTLESMEGIGKVEVMITSKETSQTSLFADDSKTGQVEGVLVVCENGDKPEIKQEIIVAVEALFDIEPHKIMVMKMKS